jgi:Cwf15/Cwc15 cell cycle control protein
MRIRWDQIQIVVTKTGLLHLGIDVGLKLTVIECSDDEEDEAAELMRELEKIKRERQEQKEKEVGLFKKLSKCVLANI